MAAQVIQVKITKYLTNDLEKQQFLLSNSRWVKEVEHWLLKTQLAFCRRLLPAPPLQDKIKIWGDWTKLRLDKAGKMNRRQIIIYVNSRTGKSAFGLMGQQYDRTRYYIKNQYVAPLLEERLHLGDLSLETIRELKCWVLEEEVADVPRLIYTRVIDQDATFGDECGAEPSSRQLNYIKTLMTEWATDFLEIPAYKKVVRFTIE